MTPKYLVLEGPKHTHAALHGNRTLCGLGFGPMKLKKSKSTKISCPQCKAQVRKERQQ